MRYINKRIYVASILMIYLLQALFLWISEGASEFSILCCGIVGNISEVIKVMLIIRILMFLFVPIAHKNMLRFYSIGMIGFMVWAMIDILTSASLFTRLSTIEIVVAMSSDILFHIALFFYSDLCDEENKFGTFLSVLDTIINPIFDILFEDDKDEEKELLPYSEEYINQKRKNDKGEINMSKYSEFLYDEFFTGTDIIEIEGEKFLVDSPINALLHFEFERHDDTITVNGKFTYDFFEEQAGWILKKKTVLNKTFSDISLDAEADANIGVDSIEEGEFIVTLKTKTFDTRENYDEVRQYIFRFMDAIILIQNIESCE